MKKLKTKQRQAPQVKGIMGRPSDYRSDHPERAKELAMLGLTDEQMAKAFGISRRTFNYWKRTHSDFLHTMQEGKVIADAQVARALYHRAIGYQHPEDKVFIYRGKLIKETVIKRYPPDTEAAKVWLRNRNKLNWGDRAELDLETLTDDQLNEIINRLTERAERQQGLRVAK